MRARGDLWLLVTGLAAGALFFSSLSVLWPLPGVDLVAAPRATAARAERFLEGRGFDLDGYRSASMLTSRGTALSYVERSFGRQRARDWIAAGLPLVYYRVELKKRGEPVYYVVNVHPSAGVIGWQQILPEDHAGPRLPADAARPLAREALAVGLGLDAAQFDEQSASSSDQPGLRAHEFVFERALAPPSGLRERVTVTVAGDWVARAVRWLRVPDEAERAAVSAAAPAVALESLGFVLLAAGGVVGFFIFLRRLRDREVQLGLAAVWPLAVLACLTATWALDAPRLFDNWEPLWPQWVSNVRYLMFVAASQAWLAAVLLAVVAAGQAIDGRLGGRRGRALWALARGRVLDPGVVRASGRGFLVGLICGGVLAAGVLTLEAIAGATTEIQPRGFFFYTLNSAAPALTSVLFFFGIALAEELGYRFFAGSWLLAISGRRWLAVIVPAAVYGLAHTRMDFLPPAEPFWGRALVLALVGCVWGWAFLRYDALTVVLSHFTADLFIFNWPRLASGRPGPVAASLLTICVPLAPFLLGGLRRPWPGRGAGSGTLALLTSLVVLAGCAGPPEAGRATDPGATGAAAVEPARQAANPEARDEGDAEVTGPGRWRRRRAQTSDPELQRKIRELEAIGYVGGSRAGPAAAGVTIHDRERAWAGINLYTSGHAAEALLVDMDGRPLHRWHTEFRALWPAADVAQDNRNTQFLRRAYLYPDGDLLGIFEGLGLVKLDRDSRVLWAVDCRAHHDLELAPDGKIYVLTREARVVPRVDDEPILEDFISVLDPSGRELRRVSLLESFERSPQHRGMVAALRKHRGDPFHTNTLHLLDGRLAARDPAFAAGNVLVSLRWLDALAVVDLEREQVVWAWAGPFRRQHDPKILADGNLLLFDNKHGPRSSSVLELDPISRELRWQYPGASGATLYSESCGTADRLPNGNTLITESDNGRALEVTPRGEIVWEFVNPHRAGPGGEYVATLFEMLRLPPDFPLDWAAAPR